MKKQMALFAVITLQCFFLVAWAGYHEWVFHYGEVLLLRTRPVDPRDILRGDYMILNYDISTLPAANNIELKTGQKVFVALEKHGEFYEALAVSAEIPKINSQQRIAQATVEHPWNSPRLAYGIERFLVPEGKGTPSSTNIVVRATLSPNHQLNIKEVLVNGKPYP